MSRIPEQNASKNRSVFYKWRRQIIDEILFASDLNPPEKLFGIAIAQSCNPTTQRTFEGYTRSHEAVGI